MNYQKILEEIKEEVSKEHGKGHVADYIPALKKIDPHKFGIALCTLDGKEYHTGDFNEPFSIQSISKLFVFVMAMQITNSDRWERVGREPSGNPFNSLVQLEYEKGRPRNPFINAGSLVVTDYLLEKYPNAIETIVQFVQKLSGNKSVKINPEVAKSELETAHRNFALANLMKSFNNINHDINRLVETYCHHCAIEMSCLDLARAALFLANNGVDPKSQEEILGMRKNKRVNAVMLTCGLYDNVGDFAYRVGLPAKSGVGGGIVAVLPGKYSICVWSPELNDSGNSLIGTRALELFTTKTGLSIF